MALDTVNDYEACMTYLFDTGSVRFKTVMNYINNSRRLRSPFRLYNETTEIKEGYIEQLIFTGGI